MKRTCAKAANVPYYEHSMEKVKTVSNDAYEALKKIDRKKWTRLAELQRIPAGGISTEFLYDNKFSQEFLRWIEEVAERSEPLIILIFS
ncbi:hypothetical protein LIER_33976 [Lithospermum erythrorhizon]|uniref:Uncharacterized protein n=1 Tax=Lithospermum erythrorhizon TaxID=34254 RepID=A0AAV3RY62_LITER